LQVGVDNGTEAWKNCLYQEGYLWGRGNQ
jgi:hypothetical protein